MTTYAYSIRYVAKALFGLYALKSIFSGNWDFGLSWAQKSPILSILVIHN
jgi:hypothetical protein